MTENISLSPAYFIYRAQSDFQNRSHADRILSAVFVLMALEHETHEGHLLHAGAINHLTLTMPSNFVLVRVSERKKKREREENDYASCTCYFNTDEFKAADTVK